VADVIKPIVRLFFPCDDAILDIEDEKWTLTNPWHTLSMPTGITGGFRQEEIWLYAQLTGGVGTFNLSVHLYDERGKRLGQSRPLPREFEGGITVVEEVFHLTNVPFDGPGIYEFRLQANHAELEGVIHIRVLAE